MKQSNNIPRLLIAGSNSGCGKTTLSCALMQILKEDGHAISSFKCGPDYIDPMFHGEIIGTSSANLDPFFYDEQTLKERFCHHSQNHDISVIEGVMGYYDGMTLTTEQGSSYDVGRILQSPVILTINCKGMANSVVAVIEGFLAYLPQSGIKGVVLNQISPSTYEGLKDRIEQRIPSVKLLGYLPKLPKELILESRHLGLVTALEVGKLKDKMKALAKIARGTLDIPAILALAESAPPLQAEQRTIAPLADVRIGVAMDAAFCFYYKDNLALLEQLGARILPFSPLQDGSLPVDLDGLILGGGYPELWVKALSDNQSLRLEILEALEKGLPCIAECGGFMYLSSRIEYHEMVGFLPSVASDTGKLTRFGYLTLMAEQDSLLFEKGDQIKGHEFHYYDTNENGEGLLAVKPSGKSWKCGVVSDHLYAGFPHLAFYSNIKVAERFIEKTAEFQKKRKGE